MGSSPVAVTIKLCFDMYKCWYAIRFLIFSFWKCNLLWYHRLNFLALLVSLRVFHHKWMLYTLNYVNAQDIDEEVITILWIFNDFWHKLSKKNQVIQCKIFIFTVTNDYITWSCSWFNKLSHMFSLLAWVSHRKYVIFSLDIISDIPDKTSHTKYSDYSKVILCCR